MGTRTGARPGVVLAILSGASLLANLDLFVVNVAFPDIVDAYPGSSLAHVSWLLSGYAIVYAALLIPMGRWADKIGQKKVFVGGVTLFTVASVLAAAAPGLWWLVDFRVLQAVGAAALTPTSLGLLLHAMPPEHRAISVRIWAAVGAAASAFGPVVGGLLVELSWRWVFLINVPFGVLIVVAALRSVPAHRVPDATGKLDLVGAVLLSLGIGALTAGLVQGQDWGWGSARILTAFALAVVALALFVVNTLRHDAPLVPPALLKVRSFAWADVTIVLSSAAFAAGLLSVILWMQDVWGWSALRTGPAIAPGPLMVPLFAIGGHVLTRRVPAGWLAAAGSACFAAGTALVLVSVGPQAHYATAVLPGWLLAGIGVGLTPPTILSSATSELPPERTGTGSAVVNMSRQIGTVVGVSLLVALLGTPVGYAAAHDAFTRAWVAVIVVALLAALAAPGLTPGRRRSIS